MECSAFHARLTEKGGRFLPRSEKKEGADSPSTDAELVANFVVEDPHKWWSKYVIVIGDKHSDGGAGALGTPPRSSRRTSSRAAGDSAVRRERKKQKEQEELERDLEARNARAQAHTVPLLLRASKAGGRSCFVKLHNTTSHRLERRRFEVQGGRWTPECEPPETVHKGERDVPFGTESTC